MSSPSPLLARIRAAAEVLELAPVHVAALLALASFACAGLVGLWWTARPATDDRVAAAVPPVLASAAPTTAPGAPGAPAGPASPPPVTDVVVHVSGAVASEGVVELPGGARVVDALEAAGGARRAARTDRLNLARPVRDGEQVHVPTAREVRDGVAVGGASAAGGGLGGTVGGSAAAVTGDPATVSLNQATATELEALPGVGPVLAQRLVEHRETAGGFTSVDELLEIEGIGEKTLAGLRDHVSL